LASSYWRIYDPCCSEFCFRVSAQMKTIPIVNHNYIV
jgi:hypothetical protein